MKDASRFRAKGSDATERRSPSAHLLIVPLFLLLVCRVVNFGAQAQEGADDDALVKMVVEAAAYALAAAMIAWRFELYRPLFARMFPFFLFALYAALTAAWSAYPGVVFIRVGHMIGLSLVSLCAAEWARQRRGSLFSFTAIFMLVVMVLSILCVRFFPGHGLVDSEFAEPGTGAARWVGITPHPNLLGAAAIVGIWAALGTWFVVERSAARLCAVTTIILSLVAIYGSDSRTSLVAVAFLALLFYLIKRDRPIKARDFAARLAVILVFGGAMLAVVYLVDADFVVAHLMPSERLGGGGGLSSRPLIWAYGLEALRDRPWGWSFDLLHTYADVNSTGLLIAHFHDGYLDVAVKGGYIGEALLLAMLGRMLWTICRLYRIDYPSFAVFLSFFVGNLVYNIVETGFDRESVMWPMMIVAWATTEAMVIGHQASTAVETGRNRLLIGKKSLGKILDIQI